MEELLKHDLEDAIFYLRVSELLIILPVMEVGADSEGKGVCLTLGEDETSYLNIWDDTTVKKVRRPANVIAEFEWCYLIEQNGTHIGYIGKK